ncbi:SLBB domain-containing protein [Terracidiphilus gabretensis]|uniref:SLBB domain-containing protein n=1 Tax=Terracidiphilus gabretensis TaxID=1577687 RepID=UPI0012F7DC95|nr:SLBB domain-containing protein [Terracidiphilus gabretensis]
MKYLMSATMRWMVVAALVMILQNGLATHGNAQALPGYQPAGAVSPPEAAGSDSDPLKSDSADRTVTMPAAQLITLLRENPEVMVEVKSMLADAAQQRGLTTQADSITDQQVYDQISTSKELRANLTQFLRARGYVTEDEIEAAQERSQFSSGRDSDSDFSDMQNIDGMDALTQRSMAARAPGVGDYGAGGFGAGTGGLAQRSSTSAQRGTNDTATSRQRQPNVTDEPHGLHRPAPYNLPSLRDLYTQTPEPHEVLKRFGSDLFVKRNTTVPLGINAERTSAIGSLDVPLGPDYVVGPGDELSITLWGGVSQSVQRMVDREGRIALPEAGLLQVAGLSMGKAEAMISDALRTQYRNAHISVTVSRLRSIRVFVVGDVQRPGAYEVSSLATPLSALFAAGGPTASGSLRVVRHYRNETLIGEIDLYDFMLHGVKPGDDKLEGGDTLLVPPVGAQVAVFGAVKRPAIYELRDKKDLASVLADAGGLTVAAALTHITIDRVVANQRREEVTVPAGAQEDPTAISARLQTTEVHDGDRVRISTVLTYNERAVYLMGHVARPGRIAYRDAMQLSDVLHSYQDLLPEPAARGEIVRLVAPDLHPETIEFSVQDVLIGNAAIALQPFDTIRIFGRYEQDSPTVSIRGEVERPGVYPLFDGMTAAQLVRAAGGFKRGALMGKADLASYQTVDGTRVSIERRDVAIGDAVLKADKQADTALRPGDVLTVHQLTGWNDIGASILIEGEVSHPGSYGFQQGEHLSDVLRRAGGFRETAYPEGAVLTRPEVAALEDKSRDELIRQIEASSTAAQMSRVSDSNQGASLQLIQQQQNQMIARLRSQPASGRLVIQLSSSVESWAGTAADIEVRTGDVLHIPKRPGFVLMSGQVYNPSAITFQPGSTAGWYLRLAGGPTRIADKKEIFIIRANGEVVGRGSGHGVLSTRLNAGDTIVVPQKIIGPSVTWRNLLGSAQVVSSLAIAAAVAVGL